MRLADIAEVVRSKNAGPYLVTFDVIFGNDEAFDMVRRSGSVSREAVAALYRIAPEQVIDFAFYGFARSIKFSIRRPQTSGARHDTDVYGAQQHAPLLDMQVSPRA